MAGQKREARLRTDDRAIHDLLFTEQDVDARHKAGHDEKENKKAGSDPGLFFTSPRLRGEVGAERRVRGTLPESWPVEKSASPQPSKSELRSSRSRKRGEGAQGASCRAILAFFLFVLRANGSRECAPDDRLREAIHHYGGNMDCFVASLLAMMVRRARRHRPLRRHRLRRRTIQYAAASRFDR
jgi:hypothetical protein